VEDAGGVGEDDGRGWEFEVGGGFEDGVDVLRELVGALGHAFGEVLEVEVVALCGGELVVVADAFAEVLADAVAEFEVAFLGRAGRVRVRCRICGRRVRWRVRSW
jgi:hypothetical protein